MYSIPKKSTDSLELLLQTESLNSVQGILHASLIPLKSGTRKPSTFVCAIDISGSMGSEASIKKSEELDLFSRLDLVKHSIRTIIHMLNPEDNLCLIPFDDKPVVELPIQGMSKDGKDLALAILDMLEPMYSTNIWGALKTAVEEVMKSPVCKSTNNYILLFTDGEPNINPPEGIMPELRKKLKGIPVYHEHFTIHTFGYGYALDSRLLYDISVLGNGIYNYIPDSTMIGTTFVNFLSNSLSTSVANARLTVTPPEKLAIKALGFDMVDNTITTGPIQFGQTRDFLFRFKIPSDPAFEFSVTLTYGDKTVTHKVQGMTSKQSKTTGIEYARSMYCRYLAKELEARVGALKNSKDYLSLAKKVVLDSAFKKEEQLEMLLRDMESAKEDEGQVTKAFTKEDWFFKWGVHYIRSLIRAHQLQICHNFKDPGVQVYGGEHFKELQDKADATFCSIPAPKPSIRKDPPKPKPKAAAAPYRPPSPPRYDMEDYMDRNFGCFDGEGEVATADGKKRVRELMKGDEVVCAGGRKAKVAALVATKVNGPIKLVELKGVKLTSWHPVKLDGEWKFPANVRRGVVEYCDVIYNLVLECNHVVVINGLEVVTLGHGFKDNTVVEHDYFGSQKVIDDMKKFRGWDKGKVEIDQWSPVRDPVTQLVQGLMH